MKWKSLILEWCRFLESLTEFCGLKPVGEFWRHRSEPCGFLDTLESFRHVDSFSGQFYDHGVELSTVLDR